MVRNLLAQKNGLRDTSGSGACKVVGTPAIGDCIGDSRQRLGDLDYDGTGEVRGRTRTI